MDRTALREQLLANPQFQPKEQDIETPYLGNLDGKLKLHGISGKDGIALRQACTINGVLDDGKLAGKLIVKCLYLRTTDGKTGEAIDGGNAPLLEQTDDEAILGLDQAVVNQLGADVLAFVGMGANSQEQATKN